MILFIAMFVPPFLFYLSRVHVVLFPLPAAPLVAGRADVQHRSFLQDRERLVFVCRGGGEVDEWEGSGRGEEYLADVRLTARSLVC